MIILFNEKILYLVFLSPNVNKSDQYLIAHLNETSTVYSLSGTEPIICYSFVRELTIYKASCLKTF